MFQDPPKYASKDEPGFNFDASESDGKKEKKFRPGWYTIDSVTTLFESPNYSSKAVLLVHKGSSIFIEALHTCATGEPFGRTKFGWIMMNPHTVSRQTFVPKHFILFNIMFKN